MAAKLSELSGAELVNGFTTSVPEEQIAAVVIDCGGTLRAGLYPKNEFRRSILCRLAKAGQWPNSSSPIFMYQE